MQFEGRARIRPRLDIAPLVDVVFLLLIFFLLTSSYAVRRSVDLVLPASSTSVAAEETPIVIVLARDGTVFVNSIAVTADEVAARVATLIGADAARRVTLEADAEVSVQAMLAVVDAARHGGARELAILTRPGEQTRP